MRGIRVGKNFKQRVRGRATSLQLKHKKLTYKEAKYLVLDEVFDELENGEYFTAMKEQGITDKDIIKLSEAIAEKGITL